MSYPPERKTWWEFRRYMMWTDEEVMRRQPDFSVWEAWTIYRLKRRWGAVGAENTASPW